MNEKFGKHFATDYFLKLGVPYKPILIVTEKGRGGGA